MEEKRRIGYIDALRGFTIILVVMQHVISMYYRPDELSPIYLSLQQIRMPLFFFVSGLVFYKAGRQWHLKETTAFFRKKIPVQLLSPAIFMFIYFAFAGIDFSFGIMHKSKCGYWFTYTLLEFFFFYVTMIAACNKMHIKGLYKTTVIILSGVAVCYISTRSTSINRIFGCEIAGLLGVEKWSYYIFFLLGALAKRHFSHFERNSKRIGVLAVCAALFTAINIEKAAIMDITGYHTVQFICGLLGIIIMFSIFNQLEKAVFSATCTTGRTLQFIGKRTLEVYLIHFFFVYSNIGVILLKQPHFEYTALNLLYILLVTSTVVAATLTIGGLLRINPTIGHLLFGANKANQAYSKLPVANKNAE